MPDEQRPPDADLDELNARLKQGLKTCRSVIENYRAMLIADQHPPANDPDPVWTGKFPPRLDIE
jgi:hypothetical protein